MEVNQNVEKEAHRDVGRRDKNLLKEARKVDLSIVSSYSFNYELVNREGARLCLKCLIENRCLLFLLFL